MGSHLVSVFVLDCLLYMKWVILSFHLDEINRSHLTEAFDISGFFFPRKGDGLRIAKK